MAGILFVTFFLKLEICLELFLTTVVFGLTDPTCLRLRLVAYALLSVTIETLVLDDVLALHFTMIRPMMTTSRTLVCFTIQQRITGEI